MGVAKLGGGLNKLRGDLDNISSIEMDNSTYHAGAAGQYPFSTTQNSLRLSQELLRKAHVNLPTHF